MDYLPINLCVFESAKGHFGRGEICKTTITDLNNKINLNRFNKRIVHIKYSNSELDNLENLKQFYSNLGFIILTTNGDFKHFQISHQNEYCKDIITMFSSEKLDQPYTLWLESDWCWDDKGANLGYKFFDVIKQLERDKDLLSIRFPRFLNEVERLKNLKVKHNIDIQVEKHGDFYYHNDNFSCNPNICRTRDLYLASLILKRNFDQFAHHSEMGFTKCLEWMSDEKLHYAIFDPNLVSVLHYGTKEGEEDKIGQVFEKII